MQRYSLDGKEDMFSGEKNRCMLNTSSGLTIFLYFAVNFDHYD